MAINKKLISFGTQSQFDTKLANGEIDNRSIVFIEDTKRIWTHGVFFDTQWNYVGGKPTTFAPSAHTLDSHSNVTITANAAGEILKWDGTKWINNTLAEAGIASTAQLANYLPLTGGTLTGILHINKDSSTEGAKIVLSNNTISGYSVIRFTDNSTDLSNGDAYIHYFNSGWTTTGNWIANTLGIGAPGGIILTPAGSAGTGLFVNSLGNVGIRTISPAYTLDVAGTGRFTGNVTAPSFVGNLTGLASLNLPLTGGTVSGATTFDGNFRVNTAIQNYNPFGGGKIYDSIDTNLFAGKWNKIKVTANGVENTSYTQYLFDQSYEQYAFICGRDGDAPLVLNIDLVTKGLAGASGVTYASGFVLLNFYSSHLPATYTARVKNKDGVWTNMPLSAISPSQIKGTIPIALYITDIEFTFTTVTDSTYVTGNIQWGLAEIEYHSTRMGLTQGGNITSVGGYIGGNLTIDGTLSASLSGNASTATKLATARAINGVNFDGTAAITITANTPATLTRGSYLIGSDFNGSTATTWAVDATSANTASKVVARDASGNFSAGTITATLSGNASTATTATYLTRAGSSITTAPATYGLRFDTSIGSATEGIFPTSNNSNAVITLNRHSGAYDSQLGFSSDGNIYYRAFTDVALDTTQAWRTIWDSSNFTNLNQLTTRNFSDLQSKPTTLSGYGITDAVASSKLEVVTELPTSPVTGTFYFIKE